MTAHAARSHAKYFSPSSADRWMVCTASPKFLEELNLPETTSDAAEEGTAAHELLDISLKKGIHPRKFKGKTFNKTWEATSEMCNKVGLVWEWCMGKVMDGYELTCERRVHIDCTDDDGTMDISLRRLRHLITADLKYGRGIPVSAEQNKQMLLYTCGVLDEDDLWEEIDDITLVIWQPRLCEEAQEFETTIDQMRDFNTTVANTCSNIDKGYAVFVPGEKQCQWCKAKPKCKDHAKWITEKAGLDFKDVSSDFELEATAHAVLSLSPDEIFAIWQHADAINSWMKSVHEYVVERVKQNDPEFKAFGLKMVSGKSNRRWRDEDMTMQRLLTLGYDHDEVAPRHLAGLGAIEDLFPNKKAAEKFMNDNTVKPPGAPTLTTADDPRPEIQTVADMFEEL